MSKPQRNIDILNIYLNGCLSLLLIGISIPLIILGLLIFSAF